MNLIEKIGGYLESQNVFNHPDAKDAEYLILSFGYISDLGCCGASDSSFVNATLHKNGDIEPITFNHYFNSIDSIINFESTVDLMKLDDQLLEYRRKHNIFEIGDLYVFTEKYSKQSAIHKVDSLKSGKGCIRHATDEEIAAGRRL